MLIGRAVTALHASPMRSETVPHRVARSGTVIDLMKASGSGCGPHPAGSVGRNRGRTPRAVWCDVAFRDILGGAERRWMGVNAAL